MGDTGNVLLHQLPLELREQIWGYVLFSDPHPQFNPIIISGLGDRLYPPSQSLSLPRICDVNETARNEIGLFLIRNVNWELLSVESVAFFTSLLSMFPEGAGFDAVRSLLLPAIHEIKSSMPKYMIFLRRCTGLTTLRLQFHINGLIERYPLKDMGNIMIYGSRPQEEALKWWKANESEPLACPSLCRIYLLFPRIEEWCRDRRLACRSLALKVAALLQSAIAESGRDIDVFTEETYLCTGNAMLKHQILRSFTSDESPVTQSSLSRETLLQMSGHHMSFRSFRELLVRLDGYIDDISPYRIDPEQTLFPLLPPELRIEIYSYILPSKSKPITRAQLTSAQLLYPLFFINKPTRLEVGLYLISTRALRVGDAVSRNEITTWLEAFPGEQGFKSIRRLTMDQFSMYSAGVSLESWHFIHRCTGLQHLTLHFDSRHCLRAWDASKTDPKNWGRAEEDQHTLLTVDGAVSRYRLHDLLRLRSVHTISFSAMMWAHRLTTEAAWRILDTALLFRLVCRWLEEQFSAQEQKVNVVYNDFRLA